MDGRNKITQDMLQPRVERSFSDEEGSSDYLFELSDNDSDSSDVRWDGKINSLKRCFHFYFFLNCFCSFIYMSFYYCLIFIFIFY